MKLLVLTPIADTRLGRALLAAGHTYKLLKTTGFTPLSYHVSERYFACMEVLARKT